MSNQQPQLCQRFWPNGQVKEQWYEVNGVLEGFRRFYLETGLLLAEMEFHNGKGNGIIREWRGDGSPKLEATLKDGEFHGHYRSYWKNGLVKEEGIYENGKALAGYRWYRDDGALWKEKATGSSAGDDIPACSINDVE